MEELSKLGFMCGVEIHQQLLTENKLFCRCPAGLYSKKHDAEVLRHMRPTLSEMGVYDGCALMEFKTKKEIIYMLNNNSVCTYEMDDTPPFHINEKAIDISIKISLLLNCQIVDEFHIARKQYLDGSIPTGFQRTGIIGVNGWTIVKGKKIRIRQISLEEDSCREVDDKGHTIFFRTDRLGMPLIEVVTEPDMKTPEESAAVVRHLGRVMRATGEVRRGLGATRQDVNVSVTGGTRVEIKGVPRYQLMPALTRTEGYRQHALLELAKEIKKRKITKEDIDKSLSADFTDDLKFTKDVHLLKALESGFKIKAIAFKNLAGIFSWQTQPGRTFAHEVAGRVRVIACLDEMPNIYTMENYPTYVGSHIDSQRIRKKLHLGDNDTAVIVWGPEKDTETAINEIKDRVKEAFDGVPGETRQALFGGITDFERILPGADRMYPDTDHPPIRITKERVEKIKSSMLETIESREGKLSKYGLGDYETSTLALSPLLKITYEMMNKKIKPSIISRLLVYTEKNLKRKGIDTSKIADDKWMNIALKLQNNEIKTKEILNNLTNKSSASTGQ